MVFVLLGCPQPKKAKKKMPRIFALSYSMETGNEPSFLITDDFNRDKIPDLVVVNSAIILSRFLRELAMELLRISLFIRLVEIPFVWFLAISTKTVTPTLLNSIMLISPFRYF